MRNWDNWISYLDNDGNLLHGKIRFCRKGTTDNITIYNSSGVAIRNPSFTDMLGRTEYQVFLEGRDDVTAYFYRYIGSGQMTALPGEDYDPTRWEYQYSSDGMDPVKSIDLTSTTAEGVATMDDLRAKDPQEVPAVNGAKLLWLYGYYQAGDKPPVLYYWDPASLRDDDGGSVIQSDEAPGQGRWILASQELHFDVRHFGIFAQSDKYSVDFSYTSQLANCATFLDNRGLDAWFPDIDGNMSYYLLDGTNTFAIAGDIYCSDAVRFMCKTGTTGTIVRCHELHKRTPYLFDSTVQTGTATLVADWVNISWVGGNCTGDARVGWVIDTADFARNISDKEVVFKVNGSPSLSLTNCLITSHGKITGNIALTRCEIRTDWFSDGYDWSKLSMNSNRILLKNCKDADTYIILKNKQQEADYGDLGEQTVTSGTLLPGALVENAQFSGVTLQGSAEMHNISGSVTLQGSSSALNVVDCWLFINGQNITLDSLQWRRGSVSSANRIQCLTVCKMLDVDVNAPLLTSGTLAEFERCRINSAVTGQGIVCKDCLINSLVTTSDVDGLVNFNFDDCYFGANGRHAVTATEPGAQVVGVWTNNFAETVHPIQLDMTKLLNNDLSHTYRYENNNGKFLPRYPKVSIVLSQFHYVNIVVRQMQAIHSPVLCDQSLILQPTGNKWFNGVYIPTDWMPDCKFFAIGAAFSNWRLTVSYEFTDTTEMNSSMTPRTNHCYSSSADTNATVADAANFKFDLFADKIIGSIVLAPKNFAMPTEITTADPETWPATNSAVVTIERLG